MLNLFRVGTTQIWLHLVGYWEVKKNQDIIEATELQSMAFKNDLVLFNFIFVSLLPCPAQAITSFVWTW